MIVQVSKIVAIHQFPIPVVKCVTVSGQSDQHHVFISSQLNTFDAALQQLMPQELKLEIQYFTPFPHR